MKTCEELINSNIQIGNVYTPSELRAMVAEEPTESVKDRLIRRHKDVMHRFERDERQAYMRTLLNIEALLKALFNYKPFIRVGF